MNNDSESSTVTECLKFEVFSSLL